MDAVEQQTIQNEREEFERSQRNVRSSTSTLVAMNPIKAETVTGGKLLYFNYYTDCSEGVKRSQPSVHLLGVGHTDSTAINIEIDGFMSAEAAKAAAQEVLAGFAKADFSQQGKSK
jgi:hypothetical protein